MVKNNEQPTSHDIAMAFLDLFRSNASVEINGYFIRFFEEECNLTSGYDDENVFEFYLDGVGDVFVTNAELSEISYDESTKVFSVGGYTFKFFHLTEIGITTGKL